VKEVTLFYMRGCSHCKLARAYMKQLCAENPDYAQIPVRLVEERLKKKEADQYDYFYVPAFYLGQQKLSEGSVDKEGVRAVFEAALKA